MSEATERLRRHVASYKYTSTHRDNCLDVCNEVDSLRARNEVLERVLVAVIPLHLSGIHIYDLDIKLGKAIAAASPKRDKQEVK